jgi:hypothetical protein
MTHVTDKLMRIGLTAVAGIGCLFGGDLFHELRRCRASDDHPSRCGDWGGGGDCRSGGCRPCARMRPGRQCLWPDNLPLSLIDTGWSRILRKRRGLP